MVLALGAVLTESALREAAGKRVFVRGEDCLRSVEALRVDGMTASASVQTRRIHLVSLDWSTGSVTGSCACRSQRQEGWCPHQVAVALAALGLERPLHGGNNYGSARNYLRSLDLESLVEVALHLSEASPEAARWLEAQAARSTGDAAGISALMVEAAKSATSRRGFVDYRATFAVATEINELLDELEAFLDSGGVTAADAAAPALRVVLSGTRRITEHADDSSGVVGDASQRAAILYARACREGTTGGAPLARWLLRFRESSPGWPETPLEWFAPALGADGLRVYRAGVMTLHGRLVGGDPLARFGVDQMRLELADHDGDVDEAVRLLTSDADRTRFGAAIQRLDAAGRGVEALALTDRAVADGRIGRLHGGNDFWLDPVAVAERYGAHDRADAGLAVLRHAFTRQPGRAAYEVVAAFADRRGRGAEARAWAVEEATAIAGRPHQSGRALVEIALGDGDLDRAWAAADDFGAGEAWRDLAEASKVSRPLRAVVLHLTALEPKLERADSRTYREVAQDLAEMRSYYELGEALPDFEALVRDLRETYRRRPSFLAALDRAGLPR